MTLEAIYFISQVIAAVALVASLVFVGLQVRQGNALAKEAARQNDEAARQAERTNEIAVADMVNRIMVDTNETG